jgi:hypothetical protein
VRLAITATARSAASPDITSNRRAFRVMVRNQVLSWVQWLARQDHQCFAEVPSADRHDRWTADRVATTMVGYWDEHAELRTDGPAQRGQWFAVTEHPDHWDIHQVLLDPTRTPAGRSTPRSTWSAAARRNGRWWSWCASDEPATDRRAPARTPTLDLS